MSVTIRTFSVSNYRSCQRTKIRLHKQLSALIGPNGSGKTNVLNALLLLKQLPGLGGQSRSQRIKIDEGANESKISVEFDVNGKCVAYRAAVKYTISPQNIESVINAREQWNFADFTGKDIWVKLFQFPPKFMPELVMRRETSARKMFTMSRHFGFITAAESKSFSKAFPEKTLSLAIRLVDRICDFVANINYYSASRYTDPAECPAWFELQDNDRLRERSKPDFHIRFLFDLYSSYKNNREKFNEFLSVVGKEGIRIVDTIRFPNTTVPSSEVEVRIGGKLTRKKIKRRLVIPQFIVNRTILSPSQLSEGTFRTLALLLYLSTDKSKLLLLEEPEVCIHHGLLASVIELMKSYATEKQIVISTHSDFVLDHLNPENIYVVKIDTVKGTIVSHLPRAISAKGYAALKEYLRTSGNLGEYWRHSGFQHV